MFFENDKVHMTKEDKAGLMFEILNDSDYSFIRNSKSITTKKWIKLCAFVVIGNLLLLMLCEPFRNIIGPFAWIMVGICGLAWLILSIYYAITNNSDDRNTNLRKLVFEVIEVQPKICGRWNSSSDDHDYFYPVVIQHNDYQTTLFVSSHAYFLCGKNKYIITYWENSWDGNHKPLTYARPMEQ